MGCHPSVSTPQTAPPTIQTSQSAIRRLSASEARAARRTFEKALEVFSSTERLTASSTVVSPSTYLLTAARNSSIVTWPSPLVSKARTATTMSPAERRGQHLRRTASSSEWEREPEASVSAAMKLDRTEAIVYSALEIAVEPETADSAKRAMAPPTADAPIRTCATVKSLVESLCSATVPKPMDMPVSTAAGGGRVPIGRRVHMRW